MKYRKKPVEVEAEHFTEESKNRVFRWAAERNMGVYPSIDEQGNPALRIPTLEGEMTASLGDYIVCGVAGELYPCKPDIFDRTYEAVEEEPEPLTPDELRELIGYWVWVVVKYSKAECQGWALVAPGYLAFLEQKIPFDFYGKKAIAYHRQPKEE